MFIAFYVGLNDLDEEFCIDIIWDNNKFGLVSLINKKSKMITISV